MDLSTTYLGMDLPNPLMPGSSPLVDSIDAVRRMEDAGASAIVLHSLFEEQILSEMLAEQKVLDAHEESYAESLTYWPRREEFAFGPDEYLAHVSKVKAAVGVPVIGSLNGITTGGWLEYAKMIQDAGADALELNVYSVPADAKKTGDALERETVEMVRAIKESVKIPVAVKLSPFYSSPANFVRQLDEAGADGAILFNRFYQPDVNVEKLEIQRVLRFSDSSELLLRLRWLAILSGRVGCSLAVTGGVHTVEDAVKALMCGAHAVQVVSALLKNGPEHLQVLRDGLASWMSKHNYASVRQMQASMSLEKSPDPAAYERANYMYVLQIWRGEKGRG